jgi:hypothetical protein
MDRLQGQAAGRLHVPDLFRVAEQITRGGHYPPSIGDAPNAPRQMGLRTATHGIEAVGDAMPSPWGDRIEIVLRELGGFIWIQITFLIIFIRMVLSSIATGWQYRRRRDA